MSRSKSLFAVLALTAIVGFCPQVYAAPTVKVVFVGASAVWQTLALGTFGVPNSTTPTEGACGVSSATAPCYHWTTSSFNVIDGRVQTNTDTGAVWIVWDSHSDPYVWVFVKVDSGVGNRCYFGNPPCYVSAPSGFSWAIGSNNNQITVWGATDDTVPPTAVEDLFTQKNTDLPLGEKVTASVSDERPEDSLWATCRSNSQSGKNGFDATDGLGYNSNWTAGSCPTAATVTTGTGNAVQSGYPGSTSTANLISWNISGTDPISGKAVPAFTAYSVGAAPVIFIYSHNGGQLTGLTNVTDAQVQQVFSGTLCDASAFGLPAAGIEAYLREPISGTMNTTEADVFRRPVIALGSTIGSSQELGVNGANPLTRTSVACPDSVNDGLGGRWRAIGTSEEAKSVLNGVSNNGQDGIGYTFFSYGNVSTLAKSSVQSEYGYAQLDGVDPIFQIYNTSTGAGYDPGQPASGELPGAQNLPSNSNTAICNGAFPCPESAIWAGGLSFPNLRNGSYRAWALLRVVSTGTALTASEAVVTASQSYVVSDVPDYVPAAAVKSGTTLLDPGLQLLRSHYQQVDGSGTVNIGKAPVNSGTSEAGGDMGGCIQAAGSSATQLIQDAKDVQCDVRPNPF